MVEASFTDEVVKKAGWDGSLYRRFIASQTCKLSDEEVTVIGSPVIAKSKAKALSEARPVVPPSPEEMCDKPLGGLLEASKRLNFKLDINL